jgi:VIT1/CCC1 family predicted Fe2+/Mn2+ transporter
LTIGLSYIAGGLVPLAPYFFLTSVHAGLVASVIVTLLALLLFGYIKGRFTTPRPWKSALQTIVVGALAAAAAFGIARLVGSEGSGSTSPRDKSTSTSASACILPGGDLRARKSAAS